MRFSYLVVAENLLSATIICDYCFMLKSELLEFYTPIWRKKTHAATKLGISRKTIQRKVRLGLLAEDRLGRICIGRLEALLRADALSGRRGPKIQLRPPTPHRNYVFCDSAFVKVAEQDYTAEQFAGPVDRALVAKCCESLAGANRATLRQVAIAAATMEKYHARQARLGFTLTPDEMLRALKRSEPPAL